MVVSKNSPSSSPSAAGCCDGHSGCIPFSNLIFIPTSFALAARPSIKTTYRRRMDGGGGRNKQGIGVVKGGDFASAINMQ